MSHIKSVKERMIVTIGKHVEWIPSKMGKSDTLHVAANCM